MDLNRFWSSWISVYPRMIGVMLVTQIRQKLPTWKDDTALRCRENSSSRRKTQSTHTMVIREMHTMPTLLVYLSIMSNVDKPDVVEKRAKEMMPMTTPVPIAALLRSRFNLSFTAETTTSNSEKSDVKPAMASEPKKRTPKTAPPGMELMIVGKATNARPIPLETTLSTGTPSCVAMYPNAAKTPMPARSSNPEFAKPVTKPVPVRLVRGFKYDE